MFENLRFPTSPPHLLTRASGCTILSYRGFSFRFPSWGAESLWAICFFFLNRLFVCLLISQLSYLFFPYWSVGVFWILILDSFTKYLLSLCGCSFCFVYTLLPGINSPSEMMILLAVSALDFFIYFVCGFILKRRLFAVIFYLFCFPFFLSAHLYSC